MKFFVDVNGKRKSLPTSFGKRDITRWMTNHKEIGGAKFVANDNSFGFKYPTQVPDELVDAVLDKLWLTALEALVQIRIMSIATVRTTTGTLMAEIGGDPDYPEVFTFLERPDGVEIDVTAAEITSDGVKGFRYMDTSTEEYTDEFLLTNEDLRIEA